MRTSRVRTRKSASATRTSRSSKNACVTHARSRAKPFVPTSMADPDDYAVVRVVPRVERGEFVNAVVIVCCASRKYLEARIELDENRLLALDPAADVATIRANLATIPLICAGGPDAG